MSHQNLTIEQRNRLHQLHQEGSLSQRQMGVVLGCSQSTISRELRRNQSESGVYLPDTAQAKSEERRKNSKHPFANVTETVIDEVKKGLKDYHSPEQIAGRLKREGKESISHETIYPNYQGCGEYRPYLRRGRGKRKRRGGAKSKRGVIPGRMGIENRPAIADEKIELGHWESDTVIGGNHITVHT